MIQSGGGSFSSDVWFLLIYVETLLHLLEIQMRKSLFIRAALAAVWLVYLRRSVVVEIHCYVEVVLWVALVLCWVCRMVVIMREDHSLVWRSRAFFDDWRHIHRWSQIAVLIKVPLERLPLLIIPVVWLHLPFWVRGHWCNASHMQKRVEWQIVFGSAITIAPNNVILHVTSLCDWLEWLKVWMGLSCEKCSARNLLMKLWVPARIYDIGSLRVRHMIVHRYLNVRPRMRSRVSVNRSVTKIRTAFSLIHREIKWLRTEVVLVNETRLVCRIRNSVNPWCKRRQICCIWDKRRLLLSYCHTIAVKWLFECTAFVLCFNLLWRCF